jgi:arabinogalactan oligomer/maltooligosaccharide transport system permease protein
MKKLSGRRVIFYAAMYLILLVFTIWTLWPVLRTLQVSLRPGNRLISTQLEIIPKDLTLDNFTMLWKEMDFHIWILNSLVISIPTAFFGLSLASTAAYALARWKFRARKGILMGILATQLLPGGAMLMATYLMILRLGLVNSFIGLILAYTMQAIPFAIWVLRGYYSSIPIELEEAAMIDGAGRFRTFYSILVPLAAPALGIVFLLCFMSSWNDFVYARLVLQDRNLWTWTLGLQTLQGQFFTLWGPFAAGSVLISLPVVVLFVALNKYLVKGLSLGALD